MPSSAGLVVHPLLVQQREGASTPLFVLPYPTLTLYLMGIGRITGGSLIMEEAVLAGDIIGLVSLGPWESWSVVPMVDALALDCARVSDGQQQAYPLPLGAYCSVRARFLTPIIGGGSLTAVLVGR